MRTSLKLSSAALFVAVFCAESSALAQSASGFALDKFDPSERGSDWFSQESLDLRGNWRPAVGIVADYAYRPLVLYNADGTVNSSIVRDQLFFHVGGTLVFADRVRLGINVPIAAYQSGHEGETNNATFKAPATADIGDIRLGADVRLLGQYGDAFTLAAGLQVFLPTGQRVNFTGDETLRIQPRVMAAGEIGPFVYAAKAAFEYRSFDTTFAGNQLGSELLFGASAGIKVLDKRLILGPELYGTTVVGSSDGAFTTLNTPFEAILGGHFTFAKEWRAGAGFGPGLSRGYGSPAFRVLGSVEWAPVFDPGPPPDRDRDGIVDADDACIEVAGVRTDDPRTNGCPPPPPPDRDRDTIVDATDACPTVPGVRSDDPRANGCPPDNDADGIADADDACPDAPGIKTADPMTNGCPSDRDRDGIIDTLDACPDVAGIKTDDPKTYGCPSDKDKDSIVDTLDACPDEPGLPHQDPKKNGCPVAFVREGQIQITEQVKFRLGKSQLDPAGDSILEAVLKVLLGHPEIERVRIEGHTDNKGNNALNKPLSNGRAAAVATWLAQHGIDKKRLTSEGFGASKPIDTNDTEDGRTNNRRVEFHIQERKPALAPARSALPPGFRAPSAPAAQKP